MANVYNSMPIALDTDVASFFAAQTLQKQIFGLRVYKISLVAAAGTTAGNVTITEPNSGIALYEPIAVAASLTAGATVVTDNPTYPLQWRDFAVTGLTGTGTRLYIWYRL